MPEHFDLAVAWDWEYDKEFIQLLESQMHAHELLFYSITHHNVDETLKKIQKDGLTFGAFLDRASDSDQKFEPLAKKIRKGSTLIINNPDALQHAKDKATMHLEFLTKGLEVPFTIIISPYSRKTEVELTLSDLANLGRPFIIKPANTTGGGTGVILGAESLKDVIESRQHHKNDKYLLQERIKPMMLDSQKAWYRIFYIFGLVLPCWWDDETHIFRTITENQMTDYGLQSLMTITNKIWEVCRLDFFSTEIAVTPDRKFVVVDYVNEICDMRPQSTHYDGVPDAVLIEICRHTARHLKTTVTDLHIEESSFTKA